MIPDGGYRPNPEHEDEHWHRIVCTCGTVIGYTDGRLIRYRCIDRRCRRPGYARLVYIDMQMVPPAEVAEAYVPIRVEIRSLENGR